MTAHRAANILLIIVTLCGALLPAGAPSSVAAERLCFPEAAPVIRDCIAGRFAQFWRAHGGLQVFGYPISPASMELNRDTGETYLTQYFERQRFELHPEHQPPYDVLLGRLGAVYLQQALGGSGGPHDHPAEPHYVPETRYAIGFKSWERYPEGDWYWDYWSGHGLEFDGQPGKSWAESLMLSGYPLSTVLGHLGEAASYQVYERTVLRYQPHAKHDPQWRIVPDRIGVWYYKFVLHADAENRLVWP